jgi:hypothetical protein
MFNLNKIKVNKTLNKNFSYEGDNVNLSFNLEIDNKKRLKSFLELLKLAVTDVEEEINK